MEQNTTNSQTHRNQLTEDNSNPDSGWISNICGFLLLAISFASVTLFMLQSCADDVDRQRVKAIEHQATLVVDQRNDK